MTRDEYERLPRATSSYDQEIALRLMGDCGLRVAEVLDVCPEHISRMTDGRHYGLEVVAGKDTSSFYSGASIGKRGFRSIRDINRYTQQQEITSDEPQIDRSKRTLQYWVETAAASVADETGDEDYRRVTSHALRRCWANHLLVEQGITPRIVMALGGWSSYNAIEPSVDVFRTGSTVTLACRFYSLLDVFASYGFNSLFGFFSRHGGGRI
jgi:integrase